MFFFTEMFSFFGPASHWILLQESIRGVEEEATIYHKPGPTD